MLTDLDEALERFWQSDFECGDGSVNQGTMAVVALEALGHPSLIPFFADVYVTRLRPRAPGTPIAKAARSGALGDPERRADWVATFEAALADEGRDAVLAAWLPRLVPGAFAAAGAGPERVASALRALESGAGATRERELALGLAHWASRYQALPGEPGARPEAGCSLSVALDRLVPIAPDRRREGPISEAMRALDDADGLPAVVAALDPGWAPPDEAILDGVVRLAALQVAHPEARGPYGRAARASMALRDLVAYAPAALHADLALRAAQIALAVHAVYGHAVYGEGAPAPGCAGASGAERDALASDVDEIRYRAACSGDADAITLAEAYLRAHRAVAEPVLLTAAADAALSFGTSYGGRGG